MAATHYYENRLEVGKIMYQWPGAVHYTVYAFASSPDGKNDITMYVGLEHLSCNAIL